MPLPISRDSINNDLSARVQSTSTVAASPAASSETIIGTLTLSRFADMAVVSGIHLIGWAAFTVGTSGVSVVLRIRETNVSGTVVASSGAVTETAANLDEVTVAGVDATPGVGVYVLTMQVASGAATSTVSALYLRAIVV